MLETSSTGSGGSFKTVQSRIVKSARFKCFACKIYKISVTGFFGIQGYPAEINTLGDHVRAARLNRGLKQWQVADMLGLKRRTINKWERNRGMPCARDVPKIIGFLGYDPFPRPRTVEEKMRHWRVHSGLSAHAASRLLGVGSSTWAAWERGSQTPSERVAKELAVLVSESGCSG